MSGGLGLRRDEGSVPQGLFLNRGPFGTARIYGDVQNFRSFGPP